MLNITTTTTTTTVLQHFAWDYLADLVSEEALTHSHLSYHPLSASSIYCDPQHPPCSNYMLDSLFAQPLSKSSLVYFLVWNTPVHNPYIFLPNHWLLFATYAHIIATCFAVIWRLCHLFPVSISTLFNSLLLQARSHFHATHYFAHNCCIVPLS